VHGHGQLNEGFSWKIAGAGNGLFPSLFDLVFLAFLEDELKEVGDLGHEILIGDGLDGLVGEGFQNGD
jgi:hypothetical protein